MRIEIVVLGLTMRAQEMNKVDLWGENGGTKQTGDDKSLSLGTQSPQEYSKPCYHETPQVVLYVLSIS